MHYCFQISVTACTLRHVTAPEGRIFSSAVTIPIELLFV